MTLVIFIHKYYGPHEREEIQRILNALQIYHELEATLVNFNAALGNKNQVEVISQLTLGCSAILTSIYKPLHEMKPCWQKADIEAKITEFSNYLIRDLYQNSGLKPLEYFYMLKPTVCNICAKHSWNFSAFESLLVPYNKMAFVNTERKMHGKIGSRRSMPIKLEWFGNMHLDFFIHDLSKTFHGVKSKKQLHLLFEGKGMDFKLVLPSKHLLPFLTLFYALHKRGIIKVHGNRGLFVYLRQHLQPPPKEIYPKRDFRKLRHEASKNERKHNNILKLITPLLDNYSKFIVGQ